MSTAGIGGGGDHVAGGDEEHVVGGDDEHVVEGAGDRFVEGADEHFVEGAGDRSVRGGEEPFVEAGGDRFVHGGDDGFTAEVDEVSVVRSEERLVAGAVEREAGKVRIRKTLEQVGFDEMIPYAVEHAEVERVAPNTDDSGDIETLPDGTVSIPVLEEQLVVEKRLVVTERLLVRKRVEVREQRVTADLAREVVSVDVDEAVDDRVHLRDGLPPR